MQEIIKNKELQKDLAIHANEMMLSRLKNIDGLDEVSWWPLAPIWWILISLSLILLITILVLYIKKRAWRLSWKGQTFEQLDVMQKTMTKDNAHDIAITLSELIKRIAMHESSRESCAKLTGDDWLEWLEKHDKKFDWKKNGKILIEEIYSPPNKNLSLEVLHSLINATKSWVK